MINSLIRKHLYNNNHHNNMQSICAYVSLLLMTKKLLIHHNYAKKTNRKTWLFVWWSVLITVRMVWPLRPSWPYWFMLTIVLLTSSVNISDADAEPVHPQHTKIVHITIDRHLMIITRNIPCPYAITILKSDMAGELIPRSLDFSLTMTVSNKLVCLPRTCMS